MDHYYLLIAGIGAGIGYYFYYRGIPRIKKYIIGKILDEINNETKLDRSDVSFKPFGRSKSAMVVFDHAGKQQKIYVPYDRKKTVSMLRKKVFLIKTGESTEITHKPGVPYLLSPKQMGGNKITIMKDGKIVKTYGEDEIPGFLTLK